MNKNFNYILNLSCADRPGVVHSVSGFLASRNLNILSSAQFCDEEKQQFFMRVEVSAEIERQSLEQIKEEWKIISQKWQMKSKWYALKDKTRVLVMVSKEGHCLNDLLYHAQNQRLPIEIAAIGSNHEVLKPLADFYQIPFHYWKLENKDDAAKEAQELKLMELVEKENIDLVVLARYMQILSPKLCQFLEGRAINIHHSFLPSFKGAKPYYQAYARGVKLIGATAHYVTTDLDEGPIIEQDTSRVRHDMNVDTLTRIGNDIERRVLTRAVLYHAEHRIIENGNKTVIFN